MTILSQRICLRPNNTQRTWLTRCAGASRFIYNWGLARWQAEYEAGGKPRWQVLNRELNSVKNSEFPWLLDLPWKIPNQALTNLGQAFTNFFRRVRNGMKLPGYPRFKKRGRCQEGFSIEGRALTFNGRQVKLPKLGWLRMAEPSRFHGKVLAARFTERAGRWYMSIQVEVDESRWSYPHPCETQAVVGVDLGLRDLAVLSTGERISAPRALRRLESRLCRLNKELHRRKRGGQNRWKTRAKLARLHGRISNIRLDAAHKLTTGLVRRFRWIGMENLQVAGMLHNHRLAKSVADAGLAEILRQLAYKAPLAGSIVVQAGRWYPSSKTCSDCGHAHRDLQIGDRRWRCGACGAEHDRDENAAKNLQKLAAAQAVTACCPGSSGPLQGAKLLVGQESSHVADLGWHRFSLE